MTMKYCTKAKKLFEHEGLPIKHFTWVFGSHSILVLFSQFSLVRAIFFIITIISFDTISNLFTITPQSLQTYLIFPTRTFIYGKDKVILFTSY